MWAHHGLSSELSSTLTSGSSRSISEALVQWQQNHVEPSTESNGISAEKNLAALRSESSGWGAGRVASLTLAHEAVDTLEELRGYTELVSLNMEGNNIESLRGIESCLALRELVLSNNRVECVRGVAQLASLTMLNLEKNELHSIQELPTSINTLKLAQNKLSEIGAALVGCKELSHLDMQVAEGTVPCSIECTLIDECVQRNCLSEVQFSALPDSLTYLDLRSRVTFNIEY